MDEKIKELLLQAKGPEDVIRIATKYGYCTEIKKNNELADEDLSHASGGKTETHTTYASYSVVVRGKNGEVLYTMPY